MYLTTGYFDVHTEDMTVEQVVSTEQDPDSWKGDVLLGDSDLGRWLRGLKERTSGFDPEVVKGELRKTVAEKREEVNRRWSEAVVAGTEQGNEHVLIPDVLRELYGQEDDKRSDFAGVVDSLYNVFQNLGQVKRGQVFLSDVISDEKWVAFTKEVLALGLAVRDKVAGVPEWNAEHFLDLGKPLKVMDLADARDVRVGDDFKKSVYDDEKIGASVELTASVWAGMELVSDAVENLISGGKLSQTSRRFRKKIIASVVERLQVQKLFGGYSGGVRTILVGGVDDLEKFKSALGTLSSFIGEAGSSRPVETSDRTETETELELVVRGVGSERERVSAELAEAERRKAELEVRLSAVVAEITELKGRSESLAEVAARLEDALSLEKQREERRTREEELLQGVDEQERERAVVLMRLEGSDFDSGDDYGVLLKVWGGLGELYGVTDDALDVIKQGIEPLLQSLGSGVEFSLLKPALATQLIKMRNIIGEDNLEKGREKLNLLSGSEEEDTLDGSDILREAMALLQTSADSD